MIDIEQIDRDAADHIYEMFRDFDYETYDNPDDDALIQALARHRLAAIAAERERGKELLAAAEEAYHWINVVAGDARMVREAGRVQNRLLAAIRSTPSEQSAKDASGGVG